MSSAREARDALARLKANGAKLRERDPADVVDRLASVLDGWHDPSSPWRTRLEREHPPASGFHPAVVREGLARALEDWSGEALRTLVERELGRFHGDGSRAPIAMGFELTAVLLAGAIPMPTLQAMLLPLVLRSPVLVKTASHDPVTARLVAESVREQDPELGSCIEVVSFRRHEEDCVRALLDAPCVLAYGSDETITAVRKRMEASQRLVAYGHRLSVAALGEKATRGEALARAAEALALDTALWDQLGCLSAAAVFVEDPDGKASERVAGALAEALSAKAVGLPRGELPTSTAALVADERAQAEMRAAAGERCVVHCGEALAWTVVLEAEARWRPSPLHRFLRVYPLESRDRLCEALAPITRQLASVAIAGFGGDAQDVRDELAHLGVSRICEPGRMQAPPFGWHHEAGPALLPLASSPELES